MTSFPPENKYSLANIYEKNWQNNICNQCDSCSCGRRHSSKSVKKCYGCGLWCESCFIKIGPYYQHTKYKNEITCMSCWVFAVKWFCESNNVYKLIPKYIAAIIIEYMDIDSIMLISFAYNQHIRGVPRNLESLDHTCQACFNVALLFRGREIYTASLNNIILILDKRPPHHVNIWSRDGCIDITIGEYDFYSIIAHGHAIPDNGIVKSIGFYSYKHYDGTDTEKLVESMSQLIIDFQYPYKPNCVDPSKSIFFSREDFM
jgi:hypothetical protein